ncbi:alpha/beta fold hydrolase [Lysinibacillus parviboronicapiens]|uniref:alpha/beta fold hydrolase n=1 Tax=Lysinibacillus parviboronicapiens TaxID=436516 RepID=UPI000D3544F8|nr:alpha/beta hydrolase [Lysinibacillus parviboronicapiens]
MAVYFKEYGDRSAPLMLFLHGGGVSGWMWEQQIQHFAPHYHCVVPDLPGHGKNYKDPYFSIENTAEKMIQLIEKVAEERKIIVIGFSLGAQILVQLLSMRPKLVDYAVINSALVRPMSLMKKWIGPTVKLTSPLIAIRAFSKIQAKTLYIPAEKFNQYYEESCQMRQHTLTRVLEENLSFAIPENFKHVETPMLVIVGEKEKSMMKKSVMDLLNSNSNCVGMLVADIGHGLALASPAFFNETIDNWLQDSSS